MSKRSTREGEGEENEGKKRKIEKGGVGEKEEGSGEGSFLHHLSSSPSQLIASLFVLPFLIFRPQRWP
jgi:hypothetical protein